MSTDPAPEAKDADVTRRTWLAAERTWLAWWRSGIAVGAVALAVGRFLPAVTHGARWPLRILGVGYGLLSVAILVIGALRQRGTEAALRRGDYAGISPPVVSWLTAAAIGLSVLATILVIAAF